MAIRRTGFIPIPEINHTITAPVTSLRTSPVIPNRPPTTRVRNNNPNIGAGVATGAGGLAGIIGGFMTNAQDTENRINEAEEQGIMNTQLLQGVTDSNSLLETWNSINLQDHVTRKELGKGTGGKALSGALSGAASGAAAGPWGAAAGAVLGGISGLTGLFGRRKRAAKINKAIDKANQRTLSNLNTNASTINTIQAQNALANYSAYGGYIDTFGGGVLDYQLASEDMKNKELDAMSKFKFNSLPNSFEGMPEIKTFDKGGNLRSNISNVGQHGGNFSNGVTIINAGGTHSTNPNQGVPMGMDAQGIPNLVEEGEVIYNNYVFSNRLEVPKEYKEKYKVKGNTFAEVAKELQKESEERSNDPISKRGLDVNMERLTEAQELLKQEEQAKEAKKAFNKMSSEEQLGIMEMVNQQSSQGLQFDKGGKLKFKDTKFGSFLSNPENLRYAPAIASGITTLTDAFGITNRPDYSNADLIGTAVGNIPNVGFTPIGNYLTYKPLDRDFYINKLNAQSGATRKAITNQAGGNRATAMAGLLAADYNAQGQLGNLARQAEEYNAAQRERVEGFNRQTNLSNTQLGLQAAGMNQDAASRRLSGRIAQAQMREQLSQRADAARAANLNNFIDNLGALGDDSTQNRWFNTYMANSGATMTDNQVLNMGYRNAKAQGITEERLKRIFPNKYKG